MQHCWKEWLACLYRELISLEERKDEKNVVGKATNKDNIIERCTCRDCIETIGFIEEIISLTTQQIDL